MDGGWGIGDGGQGIEDSGQGIVDRVDGGWWRLDSGKGIVISETLDKALVLTTFARSLAVSVSTSSKFVLID